MSYADAAGGRLSRPIAPLKGTTSNNGPAPTPAPINTPWAAPPFPLAANFGRSTFDGPNRTAKDTAYSRKFHAPNKFGVGLIIKGYQYEEHLDSLQWGGERAPTPGTTSTEDTGNKIRRGRHDVSVKDRPAIVVATFATHYVSVPLFTYSGHGVRNFDKAAKSEYLSMWDHRSIRAPIDQNPYGHLSTGYIDPSIPVLQPLSAAFFTYPVSRYYKNKVTVMGQLTPESANRLRNFYHMHIGRPFKPLYIDTDTTLPYQTLLQIYNRARRGEQTPLTPPHVPSHPLRSPNRTATPYPPSIITAAPAGAAGDRKRPLSPPLSQADAESTITKKSRK